MGASSLNYERLLNRYRRGRRLPGLCEVEWILWGRDGVANRFTRGIWSKVMGGAESEFGTSLRLGWTLPCREAIGLIERYSCSDIPGRIIDVGAGRGLWTLALRRTFGDDSVIAIDPEPNGPGILNTTFAEWCEATGGLAENDTVLASWLPCEGQPGEDLGPQILDRLHPGQTFIYIGTGPNGPVATDEFYRRLSLECDEYAGEPLPRIHHGVFPRDFIRAYRKKTTTSCRVRQNDPPQTPTPERLYGANRLGERIHRLTSPQNIKAEGACVGVGLSLVQHAMDIGDAAIFLLENKMAGPAFTLARPMLEAFVRGTWFIKQQHSDERIAEAFFVYENHRDWTIHKLHADLQSLDPDSFAWVDLYRPVMGALNDLTHGGAWHVSSRWTGDIIEPNYRREDQDRLIDLANQIRFRVACEMALLKADDEMISRLESICEEHFSDGS